MAKPKTGVAQINFELPPELLDRLKAFADERGQSLKYVMNRALIRHLDNPPPILPDPPLPACEPDPPAPKPAAQKAATRTRKPKKDSQ